MGLSNANRGRPYVERDVEKTLTATEVMEVSAGW
jgi:hypothetical protein